MSSVPERLTIDRPTLVHIDLAAFGRNVGAVKEGLPEHSRLIAMLKADGYGHGAVELAWECEKAGVEAIAVALLEEALEIRDAGISLPILILGPLDYENLEIVAANGFVPGIIGPEGLQDACRYSHTAPLAIHLKLDSGMGRMGLVEGDLDEAIEQIRSAPQLNVSGIYTHFANASEPNDPFTAEQTATFRRMLNRLAEGGVSAPIHHLANSAATLRGLVQPGDYVRVGLLLYGGAPVSGDERRLEPVMRWTTRIVRLKQIAPGSPVGYGTTWRASRPSRIATLPVGYADGYNRLLSNRGEVLIRGSRLPVVGRVSMDLVTVDVTDLPDATVGDEVVLLGAQGEDEISAEEIAGKIQTIPYEVFTSVGQRVPRIFSGPSGAGA